MSWFALEELIVARLEGRVAEAVEAGTWGDRKVPKVIVAADLAGVEERAQMAPALFVVFDNYNPAQEVNRGRVQQVEQHWVIFVVTRNARGQHSGQGVRDDARPLLDLVTRALCGWEPHPDFGALYMGADTGPIYSEAGFGYFPLRFTTRCVVRGA